MIEVKNIPVAELALTASLIGGYLSYKGFDMAESQIDNLPSWVNVIDFAYRDLERAHRELSYTPPNTTEPITIGSWHIVHGTPARFPKPLAAKHHLEDAAQIMNDLPQVAETLIAIDQSLPSEGEATLYQGNPVTESTFQPQRELVTKLKGVLNGLYKSPEQLQYYGIGNRVFP